MSEMPPSVLVTRPLPAPGASPLRRAGLHVDQLGRDEPVDPGTLRAAVTGRSAVLCLLTERIDAAVLDAAGPDLRVVANLAVGYDNVDVAAAAERGLVVTNTPDVLTEATADLTWALLLAAARRLVEGDALVRTGRWEGWSPTQLLGAPVAGRTLGIVGLGAIGTAVARRAQGFRMTVLYCARRDSPDADAVGARRVDLDELLAESDFVSLHAPLSDQSRHLIDAAALARMRPTAVLLNTARGPLVDEAALVAALRDGAIAAAGLDVFEREPALAEGLAGLPNVVLAPHVGSATTEARGAMVRLCCENILAVLDGRPPLTPVSA
jgi:glyoxylate reductase